MLCPLICLLYMYCVLRELLVCDFDFEIVALGFPMIT